MEVRYVLSDHIKLAKAADGAVRIRVSGVESGDEFPPKVLGLLWEFKTPSSIKEVSERAPLPLEKLQKVVEKFSTDKILVPVIEQPGAARGTDLSPVHPGFSGAPHINLTGRDEREGSPAADVVVVGVPWDYGGIAGARSGPGFLRRCSSGPYRIDSSSGKPRGFFDLESGETILAGIRMADAGDIVAAPGEDPSEIRRKIFRTAALAFKRSRFPLFLGGDHSITLPILESLAAAEDVGVIHIDAHPDLVPEKSSSTPVNHANFMARAMESTKIRQVTQIGIRGIFPHELCSKMYRFGDRVKALPTRRLRREGLNALEALLPKDLRYYLTWDVDAIDPAYLRCTGSLTPGGIGLSPQELEDILGWVATRRKIIGMDVVELIGSDILSSHGDIGAWVSATILRTLDKALKPIGLGAMTS